MLNKIKDDCLVLGIDPGYDRLGIAVIQKNSQGEKIIFSTCLSSNKKADFSERLSQLGKEIEEIIKKYKPEAMAMEKLFFTVNQKTAMAVAETRGMILYLAGKNNLPVTDFTPMEIKNSLTGYGHADKKQMMALVGKIMKIEPTKKILDDEYDAIAVGLTYLARRRFQ